MNKNIKTAVGIFVAAVFQSIICPYIKIGHVMPNLLCIFALYNAFREDSNVRVMITAAAAGAVMDCLTGRIFGLYTASYLFVSVLVMFVKDTLFKEGLIINIPIFFILSFLQSILFYVMNLGVLKDTSFWYLLFFIILPEAAYNTVIFIFISLLSGKQKRKKAGIMR